MLTCEDWASFGVWILAGIQRLQVALLETGGLLEQQIQPTLPERQPKTIVGVDLF